MQSKIHISCRGVFFFKYGQLHVGEKNDLKGMKKGGEMHIFSPIDLKFKKIAKKKAGHFSPAARTHSIL